MTAVTSARADIASQAYVDKQTGTLSNLTTSAKTNLVAAINEVDADVAILNLTDPEAQGYANSVAGKIATALQNANAGNAVQSVTANGDAGVVTNISKNGTAIEMTKAKVSGSDIADAADIAATQLASGVQTTLTNAAADHTAITDQTSGLAATYTLAAAALPATDAASTYATQTFVGAIPQGSQATTVTGYVQEVAGTAGTALQSVTANNGAGVVTDIDTSGTAITMTKAKVSGSDIADDAAIVATQLASGVQTTLTNAAADHTAITDQTSGLAATYTLAAAALPATDAASTYATQTFVGAIPQGATATTVTGYIDEKAAAAATAGVNNLNYSGATGGNVITQVTQTNGEVSATMGTAIMKTDTINANGTYVLTATRSGTEGNYTYTYQWENITRGN